MRYLMRTTVGTASMARNLLRYSWNTSFGVRF